MFSNSEYQKLSNSNHKTSALQQNQDHSVIIPEESHTPLRHELEIDNIDFSLMLIRLIENHNISEVNAYLSEDPYLEENYTQLISYMNDKSKLYRCFSYSEKIEILYFTHLLHEHLISVKKNATHAKILKGITFCLLALAYLFGVFEKWLTSTQLKALLEDTISNPLTTGIGGFSVVTIELMLLGIKVSGLKLPGPDSGLIIPRQFTRHMYDSGFDLLRLVFRLASYGLIIACGLVYASLCSSFLVVAESVGIARHLFNWSYDYRHTHKTIKQNNLKLEAIAGNQSKGHPFETRQSTLHQQYLLKNENAILVSDIKTKQKIFKVNMTYTAIVVALYAAMLFLPENLDFKGSTALVWGIAITGFIIAMQWRSRQLNNIQKSEDSHLNLQIGFFQEEYQFNINELYRSEGRTPPKRNQLFYNELSQAIKTFQTRILERRQSAANSRTTPIAQTGRKLRHKTHLQTSFMKPPPPAAVSLPLPLSIARFIAERQCSVASTIINDDLTTPRSFSNSRF